MSDLLWAALASTIGFYMHVSARARSNHIVYRLMHARAKVLWGHERAHGFLATSGVLVSSYALVWGLGWLPIVGGWYVEAVAEPLNAVLASLMAAATIHTTASAAMGLRPLRTVRWATSQGEESRDRILNAIATSPSTFKACSARSTWGRDNFAATWTCSLPMGWCRSPATGTVVSLPARACESPLALVGERLVASVRDTLSR